SLKRYDLEKKKEDTVQASCMTYELTPDGKKMLYATTPTNWFIASSSGGGGSALAAMAAAGRGGRGGAPGSTDTASEGSGRLNLDAIEVR
ncbi:MAG TPA: hypothetical protein PKA06_06200, partial [Gemmatales bacterium]|nr:hypothetical protein [Gemmatales bacterium]